MLKLLFSLIKLLVLCCAMALVLRADVCRDSERILNQVQDITSYPAKLGFLYPAAVDNNADALSLFTKYAIDYGDEYWLDIAGNMGSSGALYFSAMRSNDPRAIKRWLKRSASMGHAQSQFEFALLQTNMEEKLDWMTRSANAGYQPAIISMAKYTFEASNTEHNETATYWLEKAAEFDATSAYKLANLLWKKGNEEKSKELLLKAANQNYTPAISLLDIVQENTTKPLDSLLELAPEGPECAQSIQFVATSLRSFSQSLEFKQKFQSDARLATLPICIGNPIWLEKESLRCDANFGGEARLGCDISTITDWKTPLSFTHMVVFAQQGKANVNNGIMFLDQSDSYSVFVHELAHFAGFVDEYALPPELAQHHCSKNVAPNLVLKENADEESADTPSYVPAERAQVWKVALDAHNTLQELEKKQPIYHYIAKSDTCKNAGLESFKPSQQMTFLQYHDIKNIPRVYRTLWRQRLLNTANYSAISDNLAIDAFSRGDEEAGLFWSQPY